MPFLREKNSRAGFTLTELIIFTALFGAITTAFIAIFVTVTRVQTQQGVSVGVNQESRFLLDTVNRYIKESSVIEEPAAPGVVSDVLKLRLASSTEDPVYIRYASSTGAVTIQITDSGTEEPLISNRVKVSDLAFIKRSNANSKDVVDFSFTMATTLSTSSPNYVSRDFNTSVARVTSAVFETNIENDGSALIVGTSSTSQISAINNTIFFAQDTGVWGSWMRVLGLFFGLEGIDTFVGISPYEFRPNERLHVNEGGIKFDIGSTSRPDCDANKQGALWFESSTVGVSDTMAACLLSNEGVYYWTGDYINDYTTTTVYASGNVGQYTSIDAIRPEATSTISIGISYYDVTNSRLMFSRSDDNGKTWPIVRIVHSTTTTGGIGHDNSIAMPTTSTVYISYYKQNTGNALYFAWSNDGGNSWQHKQVPGTTGSGNGQHTSIAAPNENTVYISYYDGSSNDLMLAYSSNGGASWNLRSVMTENSVGGNVGKFTSIDTVGTSTIAITSYAPSGNRLMFARIDGDPGAGPISSSTIHSSYADVGRANSLAAISSSTMLVSFYDQTGSNWLSYTRSDNGGAVGSWSFPIVVDNTGNNPGQNNAIASHNGSLVHIAYWVPGGGQGVEGFKIATSFDGGTTWPRKRLIDSANNTGEYPDIVAVDGATIFASYYKGLAGFDDLISFESINPPLFDY